MLVQSQLRSHLGQERLLNPRDKDINFALGFSIVYRSELFVNFFSQTVLKTQVRYMGL